MRKILPLLVVGILVLSGLGAVAVSDEELESEQTSVVFSQPVLKSENEYLTVSIGEANSFIMKQGKPMLPSYTETFTFPFGTKIKSVTCTPSNIEMQTISKEIMPTPKAVAVGQKVSTNEIEPINYGTEPYPSNWFEYDVGCGLYNGERQVIVEVQVNPVKYHPQEKIIEYIKEVNIEIAHEPPSEQPNPIAEYQLIVIAPNEYSDELSSLITHKNGRGVTAKFVGLSEVYSGPGRDNQEKIKYYIKDAIETYSTGSVLLVGSMTKLPVRVTHTFIEDDPVFGDELYVSDLYYADIYDEYGSFCSWDSNENDIFGEYNWNGNYDDVDLHPDVYLGRLACRSGGEVNIVVNKIKTYENTQAYKQAWFTNLVLAGGDSFTGDTHEVDEGEYVNQKVADMMTGFNPDKQWASNGKLTGIFPTGVQNLKSAINAGCGFVDFSGHGNPSTWATHPHEDPGTWIPTPYPGGFNTADVTSLTNGNKLPIVTVEACSTSKFNQDSGCYNWALLYNSNGGAIGSFGATGIGYGYTGSYVIQGLIGKMGLDTFRAFALDGAITFGEMWAKGLERYIKPTMSDSDHKTVEEWEPFGDPTLVIGEESDPPNKPSKPNGPASGNAGTEYTYTTSTTDPDGDQIYYMFDWGDDTTSGWLGPYNSGQTASGQKTWTSQGTFTVKVVAKDDHGKLSPWSDTLSVSMPRSRSIVPTADGTFTAELGRRGSSDPEIYLDGSYRTRGRYKIIWGTATTEEKQGRFRGVLAGNRFIIKVPTQRIIINILGRCAFDGDEFSGNWISRYPYSKGWINGEFTPS